nr:DUF4013 domain-containing protein [Ardenticatena sp.]
MNRVDIEQSLRFVFDDESWIVKILIGGVVNFLASMLIIPFPLVYGYMLDTLKNVKNDVEKPLPEWDDFGGLFMRGLVLAIGGFVYTLPIVFFVCCFFLLVLATSDNGGSDAVGFFLLCMFFLMAMYGLALGFWFPAVMVRFAEAGTFSSMFEFGRIWRIISANMGQYLFIVIASIGVNIVASLVGAIALGILLPFTSFWALLVSAHLLGQYARLIAPSAPDTPLAMNDM